MIRTAAALYGLADADTVVFTGESAGGLGAPVDGHYALYLGAGEERPGDLVGQLAGMGL